MTAGWLLPLALLAAAFAAPAAATPHVEEAETVFRWAEQRCSEDWIPDSPARAFRRSDGSILLMATHFTNGVMTGPDFARLHPDCTRTSRGAENPDPAAFDDRYWIQALLPLGNGRLLAIGSHEYLGERHPGRCHVTGRGPRCWYGALTLLEANERDLAFRPLAGNHVLAAPARPFDPATARRTGVITASNAVQEGDWYYLLAWIELDSVQGNCLFRAAVSDPTRWLAWNDGAFAAAFPRAYEAGPAARRCDLVGRGVLRNVARSVIRIEGAQRRWATVFIMPEGRPEPEGIYVSVSADLREWSAPRLIARTEEAADARNCRAVYQYPSLIDHDSRSAFFDSGGTAPHLYLTRFNRVACRGGLDRDLVRLRVQVPLEPGGG